jgi:hypothetical protein
VQVVEPEVQLSFLLILPLDGSGRIAEELVKHLISVWHGIPRTFYGFRLPVSAFISNVLTGVSAAV